MEYVQEVLDRATGELKTQSLGNWITVTELGRLYGVGNRKVRCILHHMGVLAREDRSYRLPRHLVEADIGKRIDFPRSGYPFDVVSPKGQEAIASMWSAAVQDYEEDQQRVSLVPIIRTALATFKIDRLDPMEAQEEVCWVLDHFREADHLSVARALEVSPALVSRYAKRRCKDRAGLGQRRQEVLPTGNAPVDRMKRWASLGTCAKIE